jgi:hypothetical protein
MEKDIYIKLMLFITNTPDLMGEDSQQLLQYSRPLVEESQHSYYNTPDHW